MTTREVEKPTKRMLDKVRVELTCRRLMTVPGVGPLAALAFHATIDQPDPFRKSRGVGANLGQTPRRFQFGETDVQGRSAGAATSGLAPHSAEQPARC